MPNRLFVSCTSTPDFQPDSQATYHNNNTAPITSEFELPSIDVEQPVPVPPSGGHTVSIVDESPSAHQPSVREGRLNRHSTGTCQRCRKQLNQGRDSGCLRQGGTGSTPASLDYLQWMQNNQYRRRPVVDT